MSTPLPCSAAATATREAIRAHFDAYARMRAIEALHPDDHDEDWQRALEARWAAEDKAAEAILGWRADGGPWDPQPGARMILQEARGVIVDGTLYLAIANEEGRELLRSNAERFGGTRHEGAGYAMYMASVPLVNIVDLDAVLPEGFTDLDDWRDRDHPLREEAAKVFETILRRSFPSVDFPVEIPSGCPLCGCHHIDYDMDGNHLDGEGGAY